MKRLQNKIAESSLTLPVVVAVGALVWGLSILFRGVAVHQLVLFAVSCYFMVELSNSNALLRVRSRMITTTFIALSCAASPLFASFTGTFVQLCFIIAILILFQTYQRPDCVGRIYYSFLFFGLASLTFVQTLFFVPLLWLLMATQLQSISVKGLSASLLGLATPYWIESAWCILDRDFTPMTDHFAELLQLAVPFEGMTINVGQTAVFALIVLLSITGIVHFWLHSFEDKIRIRLLYGFFTSMLLFCTLLLCLQPQHYKVLMPLLTVFASPVIAHFLTFTQSRLTNIVFIVVSVLTLALIVLNLWMPSLTF